jgi:type I restriction enzyme S subunit
MSRETVSIREISTDFPTIPLKYGVDRRTNKFDEVPEDLPRISLDMVESWTGEVTEKDEENGKASTGLVEFQEGDVLFSKLRPYLAKGFRGDRKGAASPEFLVLEPKNFDAEYLLYTLLSREFIERVDAATYGAKMPRASWDFVGDVAIPCPSKSQQEKIASYLNRRIFSIDELVEKKQNLISRLKEKRQATIRRKITQGADEGVSLQETELPWLDHIPDHWTLGKVGWYYDIQLGKMLDEKQISGDHLAPYLRNQDVQWWDINTDDLPKMDFTAADRIKYELQPGDVLVCEGGEIGRSAVWTHEDIECYYQKALHRVRPLSENQNSRYFCYFMEFAANNGVFTARSDKSTIEHLTAEKLRKQQIPIPPKNEQDQIVRELNQRLPEINTAKTKIEEQIENLKEKRQTLITKAVTGQIDLSDWHPPDEHEATP